MHAPIKESKLLLLHVTGRGVYAALRFAPKYEREQQEHEGE
jgi:hypothetical protein